VFTAFEVVNVPHIRIEPPDEAVITAKATTVPQFADAVANVTAAFVDTEPADGAAHLPADDTRAYEPPETSVPAAESDGATVNRAIHGVIGVVVKIVVACPVVAFRTSTS
jgi:hypothetical protein